MSKYLGRVIYSTFNDQSFGEAEGKQELPTPFFLKKVNYNLSIDRNWSTSQIANEAKNFPMMALIKNLINLSRPFNVINVGERPLSNLSYQSTTAQQEREKIIVSNK